MMTPFEARTGLTVEEALDKAADRLYDHLQKTPHFGKGWRALQTIAYDYPRVVIQIEAMWGTQELQDYFTRVVITDQEGRQGWGLDVAAALITLSNIHSEAFRLEATPFWGGKPDRW